VFQSPEGRRENSPGLQAWENIADKIALKGRPIAKRDSQTQRSWKATWTDALVRRSFRNADAEKRPCGGLEVLSGRSPYVCGSQALKAWAIFCSPFGRRRNVQTRSFSGKDDMAS